MVVYDNADFYAIVGATWVEKEFQIFFSPLSTTVTHTMLGPTAGLGVTGVVPGYTWLHWYFQYQHGWLPDFNLYRPNAAPGSNYVFQNSYDQGTVGFSIRLWNPFGPMP